MAISTFETLPIRDPDGHTLEVSCGQEVGLTIQHATEPHCGGRGMPRR